MLKKPVALQTFTVASEIAKDFRGTVEKIAKMGYAGIEIGGDTGGMTPAELRKFLDGLGLKAVSVHTPYDQLTGNPQPAVEFAQTLDIKFVTCPAGGGQSAAEWKTVAEELSRAGQVFKNAGLQLCYHNHAHEFQEFDGQLAIDILMANSDPAALKWQLDTYWVKTGGPKPEDYIRKYAGRVPMIHLKDMTAGENPTFAEVGEGILNWPEIFSASDDAGVEWYIVEQDSCQRPCLESAELSLKNLDKMGIA